MTWGVTAAPWTWLTQLPKNCKQGMETLGELIPFLIPVILLQVVLVAVALVDLVRRERTRGPKWAWALVIVFFSLIGPVVYLLFGREE